MPTEAAAALITDPVSLFMFLLAVIGALMALARVKRLEGFFGVVPPLVFCYFVPMLTTTFGITPAKSDLYDWCNDRLLPAVLLLLLLSADMGTILRMGPRAVAIMLSGTFGIMLGAVIGFGLVGRWLPAESWKSIGALAASWTGGSANMYAVNGALQIPQDVFAPVQIIDPVLAYSWMGFLLFMASAQRAYERRFAVDERLMADLRERLAHLDAEESRRRPITVEAFLVILALGLVGGHLSLIAGKWLHGTAAMASAREALPILSVLSKGTLMVILVTAAGIALSFLPAVRRLEDFGASKVGYGLLYVLLPTFGVQADLGNLGSVPLFGVVAVLMIATHAAILFGAMRLFRAPLFLGATASQANVGGPASASIVATAYEPSLAPVGILMGVLGGIAGTYAGLATAYLCKLLAP